MQQPNVAAMNAFVKGVKTEFTGLNYPEDAATTASNCIFTRIGKTLRRPGIDYEENFTQTTIDRAVSAISTYRWKNVGGDGQTQVVVTQVGGTLHFWRNSTATTASPLSDQKLSSTIDLSTFTAAGATLHNDVECQFTDGNGYLFVFHPDCEPFFCKYDAGSSHITAQQIIIKIRDFTGIPEDGVDDNFRPPTLTASHTYNLQNQGWTSGSAWSGTGFQTISMSTGNQTLSIQPGLVGITVGQRVRVSITFTPAGPGAQPVTYINALAGNVVSYSSGTGSLVINVSSFEQSLAGFLPFGSITVTPNNTGFISTFFSALSVYPSNADVWWTFKDSAGSYDPGATAGDVSTGSGRAPSGFYVINAFNQQRSLVSSILDLTDISTSVRPKTGCWFAGRVWYAGADASQVATGTAPNYTWTENIYFSQIFEKEDQFGKCYQVNDPTSEDRFALLPTDGGTVKIQGAGSIHKLFPVQNGLLIFAANGIWFITGSQGIGFAANDYTIVRISSIQTISGTSFVDVQGWPMWWNEEGIYTITTSQEATPYGPSRGAVGGNVGMMAQPLTFTTIQALYDEIPNTSKKHVKGCFDTINWLVYWVFKSTEESNVTNRYQYDSILVLNTVTQAFYPYTLSTTSGVPYIHGLEYVLSPGGSTAPDPAIKFFCSDLISADYKFTFAEERDVTNWVDWTSSGTDYDYTSTFTIGYMVHGKALVKFQDRYLNIWINNVDDWAYKLQGIWDYALSGNSGKYTALELEEQSESITNFGVVRRRVRIPGRGYALQYNFTSETGKPFEIIGWAVNEGVNTGP